MSVIFANNRCPQIVHLPSGKNVHFATHHKVITDPDLAEELRAASEKMGHLIECVGMTETDLREIMEKQEAAINAHMGVIQEDKKAQSIQSFETYEEKRLGIPPIMYKGMALTGPELTEYLERLKQ